MTAGTRGPILSTSRPTLGATISPVSGIGVTAMAAFSSLYPSTFTRKMISRNIAPPSAAPMNIIAVLAAVNERMRSRRKSNIGEGVRFSHHMNNG